MKLPMTLAVHPELYAMLMRSDTFLKARDAEHLAWLHMAGVSVVQDPWMPLTQTMRSRLRRSRGPRWWSYRRKWRWEERYVAWWLGDNGMRVAAVKIESWR